VLPEIGQVVLWYPEGDAGAPPHPAVVTAVGLSALTLNVMGPDYRNFDVKSGVHPLSSPEARKESALEAGAWGFTPRDLRLDALLNGLGGVKE
jgi:N-acyl-D-aspartate/D-glutamate deacylase